MELKLPSTAGARPPKKKMMFLPKVSSCLRLPLRKPSPTPASSSSEPTPQAIPNMVRKDRNLCAHRVRKVCAKVSSSMRMSLPLGIKGTERLETLTRSRRHYFDSRKRQALARSVIEGIQRSRTGVTRISAAHMSAAQLTLNNQTCFGLFVSLLFHAHLPRYLPHHPQQDRGVIGVQHQAPDQAPQLFFGYHRPRLHVSAGVQNLKQNLGQPLHFSRRGRLLFLSDGRRLCSCFCRRRLLSAHEFVQA